MSIEWFMLGAGTLLGLYGTWAIRRDIERGCALARGFHFDKVTQPKRYRALTAFNCFAVTLILIGTVSEAVALLRRSV